MEAVVFSLFFIMLFVILILFGMNSMIREVRRLRKDIRIANPQVNFPPME